MDENTMNQDTIPEESEQNTEESTEQDTTPAAEETGASAEEGNNTGAEGEQAEEQPFLNIRFNHEDKGLTQDEAKAWAQKGMLYEPSYNALVRAAAAYGKKPDEFIADIEKADRDRYENDLREKYGDDDDVVEKMLKLYDLERKDRIDSAERAEQERIATEKQSLEQRLADEFVTLQKEFPNLTSFDKLPQSVIKAASDGMPLGYAFLLHQHFESKKKTEAENSAKAAENSSTGAMNTADDKENGSMDAFQRGFWSS